MTFLKISLIDPCFASQMLTLKITVKNMRNKIEEKSSLNIINVAFI